MKTVKHSTYRKNPKPRAEEVMRPSPLSTEAIAPSEMEKLIGELQIHKIELEMQNDELRQAQLETEAARDKYSDLYDFAPIGYFTIDEKGIIKEVNLTGALLLGIERSRLTEIPFSRFICKEDQDIYTLHQRKLLETETIQSCELRLVQKDGREFDAQLNSMKSRVVGNNQPQLKISITDVTERARAERALKESENRYRSLIESLQEGIWTIDAEANTVYVNQPMADMLGYTIDEMRGKALLDFMDEQAKAIAKEYFGRREEGVKDIHEFEFMRKDGTRIYTILDSAPLVDKEGKFQGAIAGVIDITGRKMDALALQESRDKLESRVKERTAELGETLDLLQREIEQRRLIEDLLTKTNQTLKENEERLLKQREGLRSLANKLCAAEERIRHDVATKLHDGLTQNLVACKMIVDTECNRRPPHPLDERLTLISQVMNNMIEETRNLTKDLGSSTLQKLGLGSAVKEWLVEEIEKKHGLPVHIESLDLPEKVPAKSAALAFRTLKELTFNVVKHAHAQQLTVALEEQGPNLTMRVRDDGIGFRDDIEALSQYKKGGYGLFSIQESVAHLGGQLHIQSTKGQGTDIVLTMPLDTEYLAEE